jgi:hypothetical protein
MKAAVSTSTAVFAISPSGQSAASDLWPPHYTRRNGLARVATETPHFKVQVAGVQRVTQGGLYALGTHDQKKADCKNGGGRRRLRRSLVAEHAIIPRLTRQPVGLLAGLLGTLGGHADRVP